jgi:hypothetical protein
VCPFPAVSESPPAQKVHPCFLLLSSFEGVRPAAVGVYHFVDLSHEADGFVQGNDNLVVMSDVISRKFSAFAVLEPLFADLVAADVELPDVFWHVAKALRRVDPHGFVLVADFDHFIVTLANELREVPVQLGRSHEVQGNQFAAERSQSTEQFQAAGQWQAWEINLQKLSISRAVGGAVQDGVSVAKRIFRAYTPF